MHIVHAASTMSTEKRGPVEWISSACKRDIQVCSNLNVISPNKLIEMDTVRRAFVTVDKALLKEVWPMGVGLEVSNVSKPRPVPQSTAC